MDFTSNQCCGSNPPPYKVRRTIEFRSYYIVSPKIFISRRHRELRFSPGVNEHQNGHALRRRPPGDAFVTRIHLYAHPFQLMQHVALESTVKCKDFVEARYYETFRFSHSNLSRKLTCKHGIRSHGTVRALDQHSLASFALKFHAQALHESAGAIVTL